MFCCMSRNLVFRFRTGANRRSCTQHASGASVRVTTSLNTYGAKADSLPREVWDGARPEKWRRLHPAKQPELTGRAAAEA